jgi:hypothetical protein
MTKYEKLLPFCSTDKTREQLKAPFLQGEYLWASDGRVMVRTAPDEPGEVLPNKPDMAKFWGMNEGGFMGIGGAQWRLLDEVPVNTRVENVFVCPGCNGHGFDYQQDGENGFAMTDGQKVKIECEACDGTGEERFSGPIVTMAFHVQAQPSRSAHFDVKYLHRIKALGSKVEFAIQKSEGPLLFRVDGVAFEGILMPVRK